MLPHFNNDRTYVVIIRCLACAPRGDICKRLQIFESASTQYAGANKYHNGNGNLAAGRTAHVCKHSPVCENISICLLRRVADRNDSQNRLHLSFLSLSVWSGAVGTYTWPPGCNTPECECISVWTGSRDYWSTPTLACLAAIAWLYEFSTKPSRFAPYTTPVYPQSTTSLADHHQILADSRLIKRRPYLVRPTQGNCVGNLSCTLLKPLFRTPMLPFLLVNVSCNLLKPFFWTSIVPFLYSCSYCGDFCSQVQSTTVIGQVSHCHQIAK